MKITIIGAGYVGLTTGAALAELGNEVYGIDIDEDKISQLQKGKSPIYEPGLEKLLRRNLAKKRLSFSSRLTPAASKAQFFFIAVGTPSQTDGSVNLTQVFSSAQTIGQALKKSRSQGYRVIVNKSTVPIGASQRVSQIISQFYPQAQFEVISNPEFLREGQAVADTFYPDRIVLGLTKLPSKKLMLKLYQPFDCPKLITDIPTAEMIKYASNCFLATSISFINSLARLCEKVKTDVVQVAEGMRLDRRIGRRAFLDAGIGFGGSCFPKDIQALIKIGRQYRQPQPILEAAWKINQEQGQFFVDKIKSVLAQPKDKKVAVWGLSFKPGTDDLRDAPSLPVIKLLLEKGARVFSYDPAAEAKALWLLPKMVVCPDPYQPLENADLLLIFTEWRVFLSIDKIKMKRLMKKPVVIDGRNIYQPDEMKRLGFRYAGVGRK